MGGSSGPESGIALYSGERRNISMVRHIIAPTVAIVGCGPAVCPVWLSDKINKKAILTSIGLISTPQRQKRGARIKWGDSHTNLVCPYLLDNVTATVTQFLMNILPSCVVFCTLSCWSCISHNKFTSTEVLLAGGNMLGASCCRLTVQTHPPHHPRNLLIMALWKVLNSNPTYRWHF